MDTCLEVVNAAADAQYRCSRAARSYAEAVVDWGTCHERWCMSQHSFSLSFERKLPARGAHQLLRTDAGPDAGSQGAEALPRPTSTSTEQHKPGRRACTCPEQLMFRLKEC